EEEAGAGRGRHRQLLETGHVVDLPGEPGTNDIAAHGRGRLRRRRGARRRAAILAAVKVVPAPPVASLPSAEPYLALVDEELRRSLAHERGVLGTVGRR